MNGLKFDNTFELTIRSGETGEVLHQVSGHNDISDDFLCGRGKIFTSHYRAPGQPQPWCFLLPDGGAWTSGQWVTQGSVFDRKNPWAPYCTTANNIVDTGADMLYKAKTDVGCTFTDPRAGTNATNNWRCFYRWSLLPINLQLKAFGLTGWQDNPPSFMFGASSNQQQTTFVPQTLVVLPASILVRGRNATVPNVIPSQTPDILEITYYLAIVGA